LVASISTSLVIQVSHFGLFLVNNLVLGSIPIFYL
jgi:hypothetical protein